MNHITNDVMNWCREQHYVFAYQEVWLLYVALIFIVIGIVCREIHVPKGEHPVDFYNIATVSFLYGALVLIGWFIWSNVF